MHIHVCVHACVLECPHTVKETGPGRVSSSAASLAWGRGVLGLLPGKGAGWALLT